MRKIIIFGIIVIGSFLWVKDFVASGKFQKFLDAHPDPVWGVKAQYALGHLHLIRSDYEQAKICFEKVVQVYPKSPQAAEAHFHHAECLESQGDRSGAKKEYADFLEKYPNHPRQKMVKKRLEILQY